MSKSNNDDFQFSEMDGQDVEFEEYQYDQPTDVEVFDEAHRMRKERLKQKKSPQAITYEQALASIKARESPRQLVAKGSRKLKGRLREDLINLLDEGEAREMVEAANTPPKYTDGDYEYQGNPYCYTWKMPFVMTAIVTVCFFACAWKEYTSTHFWALEHNWFWWALGITDALTFILSVIFFPIGTPSRTPEQDQADTERRSAVLWREWEYRNASPADRLAMEVEAALPYVLLAKGIDDLRKMQFPESKK